MLPLQTGPETKHHYTPTFSVVNLCVAQQPVLVPVQVTKEGLHLFQTVLAVGSKGPDLLLLLLQPGAEFRALLQRNLLAGPLHLILDQTQTSLSALGFQEALIDMKQTMRTH